ncbi:MAG: YbbR-like domain-containing protein [Bacteroidetes bacterium]|nr:YbbR-like domain-containing protein [Bacteroidota bacterium]
MEEKDDILGKTRSLRPLSNRRIINFLGCIFLASVFWLLHQLSKEYTLFLKVPVTYVNTTNKDLVPVDLPDSLDAEVSGSGFTIFANEWTHVLNPLELDMRNARSISDGNFSLATNSHPERIEGALGHGFRIIKIMPDSIIISFSGKNEKRVPVRPKVTVQCAASFRVGDSAFTDPQFVLVSGAEVLLNKINYVETESRYYSSLDRSVNETVKLVLPPELSQVSLVPKEVQLKINVDRFTEEKVEVPIEQINVPSNVTWRTFPDKAEVIFLVPVSQFSSVKPEMFRVVADYSKLDPSGTTVHLEVVKQPAIARNIRIVPDGAEFIIRR